MANVRISKPNLGFSLVEVVVALAIFGLSIGLVNLIVISIRADATVIQRIKARGLVLDQIEVLRHMSFDAIPNGTTSMLGDAWNSGTWVVQQVAGSNVLSATGSGEHVALVPGDRWADSTLSGQVYVSSSSASGYAAGVLLRDQSSSTRYRLRITGTGTFLERENAGIVTILNTIATSLPTNTWVSFSLGMSGSVITATVGGQTISYTDASPISPDGHMAVWSQKGCCASFDSITVTSASKGNTSWDFQTDSVGVLSPDWERLTLSSLPDSSSTVTIADVGGTELKQAVITIEWIDRGTAHTETATTYITRHGLQIE